MSQDIYLSLHDLLQFVKRGLFIALLFAVCAAGGVYWLELNRAPDYRARATLAATLPKSKASTVGEALAPSLDPNIYRAAALSDTIIVNALDSWLGYANPSPEAIESVRSKMVVRTEEMRVSSLIHIEVTGPDAQVAAYTANALSGALLAWDRAQAADLLEAYTDALRESVLMMSFQLASAADRRSEVDSRIFTLAEQQMQLTYAQAMSAAPEGLLQIIQAASVPSSPMSSPKFSAALAFLLGAAAGYGLSAARELTSDRLRNGAELGELVGQPVLAEFPQPGRGLRLPPEATNFLRANLAQVVASASPAVLLITSVEQDESAARVAVSLAESFARNRRRTLLVDANLSAPSLDEAYGDQAFAGRSLTTQLRYPERVPKPARVALDGCTLDVVPSFRTDPADADALSVQFPSLLEELKSGYDVIVVAATPLLSGANTLSMAAHCTGTVLVAQARTARRTRLSAAVDLLRRGGTRLLGVVPVAFAPSPGLRKRTGLRHFQAN